MGVTSVARQGYIAFSPGGDSFLGLGVHLPTDAVWSGLTSEETTTRSFDFEPFANEPEDHLLARMGIPWESMQVDAHSWFFDHYRRTVVREALEALNSERLSEILGRAVDQGWWPAEQARALSAALLQRRERLLNIFAENEPYIPAWFERGTSFHRFFQSTSSKDRIQALATAIGQLEALSLESELNPEAGRMLQWLAQQNEIANVSEEVRQRLVESSIRIARRLWEELSLDPPLVYQTDCQPPLGNHSI